MASSPPGLPPNSPAAILASPLPTPTHGDGGSFTVGCSTRIAAPPAVGADTILRHAAYPSWNRFCRSVTVDTPGPAPPEPAEPDAPAFARGGPDYLTPATQFTFDVHMDAEAEDSAGRATALVVTRVERIEDGGRKGWRVAWGMRGTPGFVLRSERVQEFIETADGETEYVCWETFYGLLAPVVRLTVGAKLITGFGVWMEGLKGEAEKKAKGSA